MKKSLLKIIAYIAAITFFCTNFVYAQTPNPVVTDSLKYDFLPEYTDDVGTTLKAYVTDYIDIYPPDKFDLIAPSNGLKLQNPYTTFSWKESHDNKKIDSYTFYLEGTLADGTTYKFEKKFSPSGTEDDDFRVWKEDDKYYLELKSELKEGKYKWHVSVSDSQNTTNSDTWEFTYSVSEACAQKSKISQVTLAAPNGPVDSLMPAIILNYVTGGQPTKMKVTVDGSTVFENVSLSEQTNSSYAVRVSDTQVTFQSTSAYLTQKKAGDSYTLALLISDDQGCEAALQTTITVTSEEINSQSLIPYLTTPTSDYTTTTAISTFSWYVCVASSYITSQSFLLDGNTLYTLPGTSNSTADYTLTASSFTTSSCSRNATRYTLVLKDAALIKYNDPGDATDWHRWQVRATGRGNLSASSSVWRFRYLPGSVGTYYWCTDQQQCTSGTLQQCLASGKNCYLASAKKCEANANLDCSTNPPVQSYYWCTNQSQCVKGTLAECVATGKNCYTENTGSEGCVKHAYYECDTAATYYWCTSSQTCGHGTFAECTASGKPCYRQDSDDFRCSSEILANCKGNTIAVDEFIDDIEDILDDLDIDDDIIHKVTEIIKEQFSGYTSISELITAVEKALRQLGVDEATISRVIAALREKYRDYGSGLAIGSDNPFGTIPDFMPNLVDFLSEMGIDNQIVLALEALSTQVFPYVSTIALLPIGLLILFFPRPRGRVYDSDTRQGIAGALVIAEKDGQYVNAVITGKRGYFTGLKLPPGEYQLLVSTLDYIFPTTKKDDKKSSDGKKVNRNFYRGEVFRVASEFSPMVTYQIPVDLDDQVELTESQKRDRDNPHAWAKFIRLLDKLINALNWLWTPSFLLVIIITLIYPIWLNIIILGVYLVGFARRLLSSIHRANLTGRILDADGQPVPLLPLTLTQVAYKRLAGHTRTNRQGYFEIYLHPAYQYQLGSAGYIFVEEEGDVRQLLIDFGHERQLNLLLVIKQSRT